MASQIKPSVTNPTIASIYQDVASGALILRPDFQRRFVWTVEHQEEFIDTILNGYPFPEIYICTGEVNVSTLKTTHQVIDGQQRLTTIKNYIDGKVQRPFSKILPYKDLTDEQKKSFVSYQIVVRDIGQVEEATVKEIFRRINLTKFKLEDIEIHNAIYDGFFIQTAKKVLETVELEKYGVLKESEFTRMADLHFILLVMATIENEGYFAQDREVENKVAEFNDEYPNKDHMMALLIKAFAIINDLNLPVDSIWFRKSNFFTLVVELAFNVIRLPELASLRERLLALEREILKNRNNSESEFSRYYSYMYQATHGRTARVTRAEFFDRYVIEGQLLTTQ